MNLAPERPGQPRMMTVADGIEAGHWYSPEAVREMVEEKRERIIGLQADGMAALIRQDEREQCAKVCEGIQQRDGERQAAAIEHEDADFYAGGFCSAEDCAEAIRALGNQ